MITFIYVLGRTFRQDRKAEVFFMENARHKVGRVYICIFFSILILTLLLNLCAWKVEGFSDTYRRSVFPVWGLTLGKITSHFNFSVGEYMIFFGLFLAALFVLSMILFIVNKLAHRSVRHQVSFFRGFVMTLDVVALVMTLNCFIIYHCSTFDKEYMEDKVSKGGYSYFELASVRDYVVDRVNELSKGMMHDEEGNVIYNGTMDQMKAEAVAAMQNLGTKYPELSGNYNVPKELMCSDFISQQSMRGYYFPFSMESNINNKMTTINMPSTMCHELAHTKGFIYEDEANFIAYLACINSDDTYFQYSGYLSVLYYLDNDFKTACGKGTFIYSSHAAISDRVKNDNVFLTASARKAMEKNAVVPTKTVQKGAKAFINTNLVVNGIPDGDISYSRVVGLMLEYYEGSEMMQYDDYMFAKAW